MIIRKPQLHLNTATTLLIVLLVLIDLALVACAPAAAPVTTTSAVQPAATSPVQPTGIPTTPPPVGSAVAILVIDDFGSPKQETIPTTGDCLVAPDGQYFSARGGSATPTNSNIPHGELVFSELEEILKSIGRKTAEWDVANQSQLLAVNDAPLAWMRLIEKWDTQNDGSIYLVKVDTDQYQTAAISTRIQESINQFSNIGINNLVLNMSFAIVPCDPAFGMDGESIINEVKRYCELIGGTGTSTGECMPGNDSELKQLADTLDQFLKAADGNGNKAIELLSEPEYRLVALGLPYLNLYQAIRDYKSPESIQPWTNGTMPYTSTTNGPDPLFQQLATLSNDSNIKIFSVAAAGNSGLRFPFAPALWQNVLGVSAFDAPPTTAIHDFVSPSASSKASYSNSGEVMLNGAYYDATITDTNGNSLRGTSFAAPEMSVLAALHLLKGGAVNCGGSTVPAMKYAPDIELWNDKSVGEAIKRFCDDFREP